MLIHKNLWDAIDTLAQINGFSTSGLAKKSGLDPTIFNKSKRISNDGRERWPTTESIAKILKVSNFSMGQFAVLTHNNSSYINSILLPDAKLSNLQSKKGFINTTGVLDPDLAIEQGAATGIDSQSFTVKINTGIYASKFEKGTSVIATTSGGIRKKDVAIIAMVSGGNIIAEINKISSYTVEITSIDTDAGTTQIIANKDILWMARILYKSIV